ncbi:MAG: hypothetical protein JWR22_3643 [Herminiimonas sp.]|nr:hypothetical protein [Herminiimonas sp.]
MQNLYSERKAAQAAAYFLFRARGRLSVLKLMKLLYLAERKSYELYGEPMIGDTLVSMEHGPVLSRTLNKINGMTPSEPNGWDKWISDREGHAVALRDSSLIRSPEEDLLELSGADTDVLNEIWTSFGHFDQYELRDYTHDQCPEWVDPHGSSFPIHLNRLLQVLQFAPPQSAALVERIEDQKAINAAFSAIPQN